MIKIYNAQVDTGLVVTAAGNFPVADHCAEIPEESLAELRVNRDWVPFNGQTKWPTKALAAAAKELAEAQTPAPPANDPTPPAEGEPPANPE